MKLALLCNEIRRRAARDTGTPARRVEISLFKHGGCWSAYTWHRHFRATKKQGPKDALLGLLAMLREKKAT